MSRRGTPLATDDRRTSSTRRAAAQRGELHPRQPLPLTTDHEAPAMAMTARRRDDDPVIPLRAEFGVLEELEYDPETRHVSMRGLRTACLVRGWTIDDLARVAKVARGTLYKWDAHAGTARPKDETLVRVVQALTERKRLDG